jgi:hypothetical protein
VYNAGSKGYIRVMTPADPDPVYVITDAGGAQPLPPPATPSAAAEAAAQTPSPRRSRYWHVFGGPLKDKKGGRSNFVTFTAGPVTKPADAEVTGTTIPGEGGETFSYLGSFPHDPSDSDLSSLKPKAYR